ncbi:MAG: hypothetical protein ACRD22_05950 [Terriglobia bacterium]
MASYKKRRQQSRFTAGITAYRSLSAFYVMLAYLGDPVKIREVYRAILRSAQNDNDRTEPAQSDWDRIEPAQHDRSGDFR